MCIHITDERRKTETKLFVDAKSEGTDTIAVCD